MTFQWVLNPSWLHRAGFHATKSDVQYTFWGVMGYAPHDHMEKAFAQRRELIVGEDFQLKIDIDVYNELNAGKHGFDSLLQSIR